MDRPRCPMHGLVLGDAGCLRCRRAAEAATTSRPPFGALLVGLVALAVVGMAAVRAASMLTDQRSPASSQGRPPPAPARLGPGPAASPGAAPRANTAGESREARIAAEMKSIPVTLYAADYCPWCRKAKAHMDSRGIAYSELHIDQNPAAKREMARIGGRGIPTIDIEGEVRSGYDPAWVERTLRAHAERRLGL